MAESSPKLSIAERIDSVCDQFEREFRQGPRPSIESVIGGVSEGERPALFRALLELELELRQNAGETPQAAEYETRFPKAKKIIHAAFEALKRAPTMMSSLKITGIETSQGPIRKDVTSAKQAEPLKKLGRFEIKSVLGEGAFGTVYRARDPQLDRDVAVKVPRFAGQQSTEDRERFLREARAAAGLHHAHICPVHEVGTVDGRDYIVLSFIDGKALSKILQAQPKLTDRQIAAVIRKLALALQDAHDQGIIHRDLKPANIMINRKGEPVIMDFGLARRAHSGDAQISQSGQIMGTPAYMSPEQARGDGKAVGPATDIYSLGIVLYEMICGRRPFEGTVTEVIGQILHVEPPLPIQFRPNVDERLQSICLIAIAKNAADRFESMKAFAAALADYARAIPSGNRPAAIPAIKTGTEPATNQFADLLAAISSDVESKVERAVRRVERPARVPWWTYFAGSAVMGLVILLGIFFFIKKDTVTVIVNIPGIDTKDPSLTFVLDGKPVPAETFAAPVELKPGEHELVVNKDGKEFKRFRFHIGVTESGPIVPEDVTPKTATPEEILARLQGRWIAIEQSRGGNTLNADALKAENKVLTISESRFSMEYQLPDNPSKRGAETGTITRIDPSASPAEIDMVFERGTAGPLLFKGIFELEGNRLVHCYRKCHESDCQRPVDYTTTKGEAVFHVVYEKAPSETDDWIDLFNGKDLTGWTPVASDGGWSVQNGVLTAIPGDGWLATNRDYANYELELEYRIPPNGNTGVFLRAPLNGAPSGKGLLEVQAIDDSAPQFKSTGDDKRTGAVYGLFPVSSPAEASTNVWNKLSIRAEGLRLIVSVNGRQASTGSLDKASLSGLTPEMQRPTGRIGVQRRPTTKVEFRNIRIRTLESRHVGIPNDARAFNGHSYKFFPDQLAWKAAKARCETVGGHLVIIETAEENAFLARLITDGGKVDSWIGATDEGSEGQWHWVDGRNVTWTNWFKRQKQPNNKGGVEHFALMSNKKLAVDGLIGWEWADQPNESLSAHQPGYICEWDQLAAMTPKVDDPDRKAAEQLLSLGRGFVKVNGQDRQIRQASGLPTEPFRLTGVYFAEVKTLDDNALAVLKDCVHLTELDLRSTRVTEKGLEIFRGKTNFTSLGLAYLRVTDAGLEIFKDNKNLKALFLHDTFLTDKGLSLFHDCKELGTVWVGGTTITDVGMLPFRDCKFLKWLDVRATKVTREGVQTMKAALPACRVDADPDKR